LFLSLNISICSGVSRKHCGLVVIYTFSGSFAPLSLFGTLAVKMINGARQSSTKTCPMDSTIRRETKDINLLR
jgi:hypothetical protein